MQSLTLTVPEFMFVVGTRAAFGAGIGLLVADKLDSDQRRAIGTTLALLGAVTTVPAVMAVFRSRNGSDAPPEPAERALPEAVAD
jgi:hypothetical protein